jgi:transcriptional regulator with XRE-family HTH domain
MTRKQDKSTETRHKGTGFAVIDFHDFDMRMDARAKALYAAPGGPLMGWLCDEAKRRSDSMQTLAKSLGVTYGYISQLRNGFRSTASISQEFAFASAQYLGVPTVVVKLLAGNIRIRDFMFPNEDEESLLNRALGRVRTDPVVGAALPANVEDLAIEAKRALVLMYGEASGTDPLGARRLPEIVHWLQRASLLYADRCVQAHEH